MAPLQSLLNQEERQAPRALVEHALLLVGRIHRAGPEAAQAADVALQRWRRHSPAHAEAAATAQRIWNATSADSLREHLPPPPSAEQLREKRRRVTGLLGLAGLLAATGAGGRWYWLRPVYELARSTGLGQTFAQALPDGSQLDLAARTGLQVAFYRDRRTVRLSEGEVRFAVARDVSRPFTVETAWGSVRVLGTVFTVSARRGRMRVAVAEGRVAVWPGGDGRTDGPATILQAGEVIGADAQGLGERTTVDAQDIADWTSGWLVFRNTPLPEAVARWNDYLARPLHLPPDAALRGLRVTGSYLLSQPQAFVDSLPAMLPVHVVRGADGTVEITARH